MAETFHAVSVQKSRKRRQCSWCAEMIEVGDPYEAYSFRDGCDFGRVQMHPECLAAARDVANSEGCYFEWSIGEFHRGCGCAAGDCKCKPSESGAAT